MLMCARCLREVETLFNAPCHENPEELLGAPIGLYHCPECGTMLLAGVKHGKICMECIEELED